MTVASGKVSAAVIAPKNPAAPPPITTIVNEGIKNKQWLRVFEFVTLRVDRFFGRIVPSSNRQLK
jgi:hypothetical protein